MKREPFEEAKRWVIQAIDEFNDAEKLDRYYIPTRYPNGLPGGIPSRVFDDPKEALDASNIARDIINFIKNKFNL